MPENEKFWRYEYNGRIAYHRGKMWRGIHQEEVSKEECIQHLIKQIEGIKNSTAWYMTPEVKKGAIRQIVEELKELGVEVKA